MTVVYEDVAVIAAISEEKLKQIKKVSQNVHYYPEGNFPVDLLAHIDIWYTTWTGLPSNVTRLEQVPRTKVVQLSSAGANKVLDSALMQSDEAKRQIKICSASGIHTLSIPQWIIASSVSLYMKLQLQFQIARNQAEWPTQAKVNELAGSLGKSHPGNRTLYGKMVGLLGYGHIARETARLFKAFNCEIIAANSKGDKRPDKGYTVPGTGDLDGSLPREYFSTNDPASFDKFLSQSDILISSLPSTPQTTYMLTEAHFQRLPEGAIFLNVGRGDLVKSDVILAALDAEGGLSGVALDVTDPEPLSSGHPLFTHPAAIVTGHTSGSFEGYFDAGADILLAQLERLKEGEGPMNVVDPEKGY